MKWLPKTFGSRVLLIGLLVLAGYGQTKTWKLANSRYPNDGSLGVGMDFYQFRWVPFWARKQGLTNFYSPESRKEMGEYSRRRQWDVVLTDSERQAAWSNFLMYKGGMGAVGTPFFYTVFGYTRTPRYERDLAGYRLLLLFISELTILLLCRGLSFSLTRTVAVFALFCYWFKPYSGLLEVSNVNHLQLGFVGACALSCRYLGKWGGPVLAGAVIGFALMFKPNPIFAAALFYLVYLARRDFARFFVASFSGLLAVIAAFVMSSQFFWGPSIWQSWLNRTSKALQSSNDWNLSMVARFREWTGINIELYCLVGLLLLAAALTLWSKGAIRSARASPANEFRQTLLVMGVGLMIPLVAFRVVWEHYFTLAIPLILYLFRPTTSPTGARTRYILTGVAVALLMDIPELLSFPRDGSRDMVMYGLGSLILLALGLVELTKSEPAEQLPEEQLFSELSTPV